METYQRDSDRVAGPEIGLLCGDLTAHFQSSPSSIADISLKSFILAVGEKGFLLASAFHLLNSTVSFPGREPEAKVTCPNYPDISLASSFTLSGKEVTVREIVATLCSSPYSAGSKEDPRTALVESLSAKPHRSAERENTLAGLTFSRDR